ncbi:MAG TPA: cytochrome c [Dehalococcoidia bacterium]|nr:cytochrome c [Dehalococcoidia bacterium]
MLRRLRVPPGPILGAIMMSGLAFTLIAIIIARSPYTHGNLSPQGYNRTDIIYLGQEHPFEGFALADPSLASTGDPAQDGRILFFRYGCASCHGLKGQGSSVGKDISDASEQRISRQVRAGPKAMPSFDTSVLPDSDLQKLIAFLNSIRQ